MADYSKFKIDFGNPLEEGYDDIAYDPYDLIDAKSARIITKDANDKFTRRNVFKGVEVYEGMIISEPIPLEDGSGFLDKISSFLLSTETEYRVKVHCPSIHSALGNPCDMGNLQITTPEQKQAVKKSIFNHPWALYRTNDKQLPGPGSIVKVRFAKSPAGGRAIEGIVTEILYKVTPSDNCAESLSKLFNGSTFDPNALTYGVGQVGKYPSIQGEISERFQDSSTDIIFAYPYVDTTARITSKFGQRNVTNNPDASKNHKGIDIGWGGTEGNFVLAAADGKVSFIGENPKGYGSYLKIDHSLNLTGPQNRYESLYAHLLTILVKQDQEVKMGQLIAYNGGNKGSPGAGNSKAAHLHFEIFENGKQIDPTTVIGFAGVRTDTATKPAVSTNSSTPLTDSDAAATAIASETSYNSDSVMFQQ